MLTDHLVPLRLWSSAALGSDGTLTSAAIDNTRFKRLESLIFQLTVASGNPSIKIERLDGDGAGNYSSAVVIDAATGTTFSGSPSGVNVEALDAPLVPDFKIKLTELASKATTVSMTLEARE